MPRPTESLTSSLPALTFVQSLVLDVLCALAVYIVYNKFEVNPANYSATFILLAGIPALPTLFLSAHTDSGIIAVLLSYSIFYAVLVTCVALYRISPLHPLAVFPGPISLKISKFATLYHALDGKQYLFFKALHDKYGPIVRIGPNEISVADVAGIQPILGNDTTTKGPFWIAHTEPGTTPHLLAIRDPKQHTERRKLWSQGFTSQALNGAKPVVANRILQLVDELTKRSSETLEDGKEVDLAFWIKNFQYDLMADIVFGGGFEHMRDGDKEGVRSIVERGVRANSILGHVPWATRLLFRLRMLPKAMTEYREYVQRLYELRKQEGPKSDLFHIITNEGGSEKKEIPREQALNDMFAAILGGAGTASSALSSIFFHLLSNPESLRILQAEVDNVFPPNEGEPFDLVRLANMPYLNAVINEALRLQPSQPTSIQRSLLKNSGGKWIAGRFIAESTAVYIPFYVLFRDERYFSPSPSSFIPERWIDTSGKYITETAAFIPFSVGPANCLGKNLALAETRILIATFVQKFDMRFAKEYHPSQWEKDKQDFFITAVGKMPVILTRRK